MNASVKVVLTLSLPFLTAALAFAATPAAASAVALHQGTLQQFCYAKYQPRGIQAVAQPVGINAYGAIVQCKLPGVYGGFTIENQTVAEVCSYIAGSPNATTANGGITCIGRQNTSTYASPRKMSVMEMLKQGLVVRR